MPTVLFAISVDTEDTLTPVKINGAYFAQWVINYSAVIAENYELPNFPFDVSGLLF